MLEIPNLNKVFEDDTCTVYIHDVYGNGELLVFHADVIKTTDRKVLDHYFDVVEETLAALKEKGVKELEAWVCTDEEIKFAQFFGWDEFLGELLVNEQPCLPAVYRLNRKL